MSQIVSCTELSQIVQHDFHHTFYCVHQHFWIGILGLQGYLYTILLSKIAWNPYVRVLLIHFCDSISISLEKIKSQSTDIWLTLILHSFDWKLRWLALICELEKTKKFMFMQIGTWLQYACEFEYLQPCAQHAWLVPDCKSSLTCHRVPCVHIQIQVVTP